MSTGTEASADAGVKKKGLIRSEDWLAIILGGILLLGALAASATRPDKQPEERLKKIDTASERLKALRASSESQVDADTQKAIKSGEKDLAKLKAGFYSNPAKPYVAKLDSWKANPAEAFYVKEEIVKDGKKEKKETLILPGVAGALAICLVLFVIGAVLLGEPLLPSVVAFAAMAVLTTISLILTGQDTVKYYNFEYPIWALLVGMLISNTIGTPSFLRPAIRTELYIKTGLVLLGAGVLLSRLLTLGVPGILVSWVVTPITLITTYIFGQHVLRMPSKSLNMVISADMSVCGVSAAIATGAACKAKKEELSLAIGISLAFTAVMMVVMPLFIKWVGMDPVLAGVWLGGTIDSTGAVAAAGKILGDIALDAAVTIKMIQNILIGVVSFGVAVYWVSYVERTETSQRPDVKEIWYRLPKFVLGFVGASVLFSWIYSQGLQGQALAGSVTGVTETVREYLFCLAFVAIGLETNFVELSRYLKDGKAITLYVCGQTLNLALTLLMAWIMFFHVFPQAAEALKR